MNEPSRVDQLLAGIESKLSYHERVELAARLSRSVERVERLRSAAALDPGSLSDADRALLAEASAEPVSVPVQAPPVGVREATIEERRADFQQRQAEAIEREAEAERSAIAERIRQRETERQAEGQRL